MNERVTDMQVFAIFDSVTGSYRLPGYAINELDLQRQLENMMKDPQQSKNELFLNPEGFTAFRIGDFDRRTGVFTVLDAPKPVFRFVDLVTSVQRRMQEALPIRPAHS